jgi:hypothetical protein
MATDDAGASPCQPAQGVAGQAEEPERLGALGQYGRNLSKRGSWPVSLATLERQATPILMEVDVPTDSDPVISSALHTTESGEDGSEGSPSKNMMGGSLSASEEEGDVDEALQEAASETPAGLSAVTAEGVVPR